MVWYCVLLDSGMVLCPARYSGMVLCPARCSGMIMSCQIQWCGVKMSCWCCVLLDNDIDHWSFSYHFRPNHVSVFESLALYLVSSQAG